MPFEFQAQLTKKKHHKNKVLQMRVQDSLNIDPRLPQKRRREETETEIAAIEDKNERKRRKKEERARQSASEGDIQPISQLRPAIIGTLEGEPKKAKMRKDEDARKIDEQLAMVCLSKY